MASENVIVTIKDCISPTAPITRRVMKEEPLQIRAKAAGLTQTKLAKLLGVTEATMSHQLRGTWASGTPRYVIAVIIAYELLSHDQRMRWLAEIDAATTPQQ